MPRPSIALCCILKNEVKNIKQLLASVEGCFDEIHFTDTGSTDGSIELIQSLKETYPIKLHHFTWIDDFAAARNANFHMANTDYIMWMDLDDVLSDKKAFIEWRNSVLELSDFWVATYHYASDAAGKPTCSFARERVIRSGLGIDWKYFIHEGMIPKSQIKPKLDTGYAIPWSIVHKRTEEDIKVDAKRNLTIFEKRKENLDPRMRYYYGKELFEQGKTIEAFQELVKAVGEAELESHDRIMGIQYACYAAMQMNQYDRAISLSHQGLQLAPQRAELYTIIADSYLKLNRPMDAIPYYKGAASCPFTGSGQVQGAMFSQERFYKQYPLNNLARIYVQHEMPEKAEKAIEESLTHGADFETMGLYKEFQELKEKTNFSINVKKLKTEDIAITCHPNGYIEWDKDLYETVGLGGSETAVVEMSHWLNKLTGRPIQIFNSRKTTKSFGDIHYRPAQEVSEYFKNNEPHTHIAWRHNVKFTNAPTYIWCHDLGCPSLEKTDRFQKLMALSPFHKRFLHNMLGVPEDKIWVTSNGINPERFRDRGQKVPGRVIYSSSPDRGLEAAMLVMDQVVKTIPEAHLEVFYGFDNMVKVGRKDEVKKMEEMIHARPYVHYRGNVNQTQLTKEMKQSQVWLYPTNFLETYCITAIEMLLSGVYPVTRPWGALLDTLKDQPGTVVEGEPSDPLVITHYAEAVIDAIKNEKWQTVTVNPDPFSWESVARSWIKEMGL